MLNNISWAGYWLTIALLTGIYYLIVFFLYYRNEFKNRIAGRYSGLRQSFSSGAVPFPQNGDPVQQSALFVEKQLAVESNSEDLPEALPDVQSLVDEVQAFFEGSTSDTYSKERVLAILRRIVQKHPSVQNTVYKNSVNQLIVFLAEQNCSVHLSAEEVMGVWLR